jgi:hypothetical protein
MQYIVCFYLMKKKQTNKQKNGHRVVSNIQYNTYNCETKRQKTQINNDLRYINKKQTIFIFKKISILTWCFPTQFIFKQSKRKYLIFGMYLPKHRQM